jgi:hypothetical protein
MKILFKKHVPDILKYLADIADERGLYCWFSPPNTLVIKNQKMRSSLEIENEGVILSFWYMHHDDVIWCNQLNLTDPNSLKTVMKWLDRVECP